MATFIEIEGEDGQRRFVNMDMVERLEGGPGWTWFGFNDGYIKTADSLADVMIRAYQAGATVAEMPRTRRGPEGGE